MKFAKLKSLSILLLLAAVAGCAASTEVLIQEAHECDANKGSDCWDKVNARIKAESERERENTPRTTCGGRSVLWCDSRHARTRLECRCVYMTDW